MSKRGTLSVSGEVSSLKEGTRSRNGHRERIAELENQLNEANQALRLSSSKLRMALDVGKLGAWERDLETGIVTGSPAFKAALGLSADASLTYEELARIFHPGDSERIEQAIAYSLRTRTDFNIEHRIIRADGRIGRVLARGGAVYEGDKPVRIAGVLQDMTEREKAKEEATLAQRRQEFLLDLNDQIGDLGDPLTIMETAARSLAKFLHVDTSGYGEVFEDRGIIIVEREWSRGLLTNEGKVEVIAQTPAPLIDTLQHGQPVTATDVKIDPRFDHPAIQSYYSNSNIRAGLTVPLLKNGRWVAVFYVFSSVVREWTSDDIALVEDVANRTWIAAEKARAEEKLLETQTRFQMIAESLPAIVWILNPNVELVYTNEWWVKYSGIPPEDALGHSWMSAIHPDDMARMRIELESVVSNHTDYETEARYRSAEGLYRWHLIHGAPFHGPAGEFKGWVGTSVDIHDLKMTEEALRRSEEQLRLAFEAAQMGDWRLDGETDVIHLSERGAEIFALPPGSKFTRSQLRERIVPADLQRMLEAMQHAVQHKTQFSVEYRVRRFGDDAQIWVASQGQGTYHPDGTASGMTGVIQDITERKHAEERQQLLIRELHHRVKNTLATVQAIVGSTARTATSIDDFYQGFVGRIVSLARTHNLLTEDLWQKADLRELVETELGPYEDEARNRVLIDGPPVELPSEAAVPIGMAMHELTTNAAKHGALSTFGGQVEVRWRIEPGPERPGLHFTWIEHGGPRVTAPARQGFGSRLLQRVLTTQLQAQVKMEFQEHGLEFTMTMPIPGEPPLFNPDK
ncbi:PAS domain-containing protein [Microvirga sp. ACRRW]|uniref:PAS domain-containing protein n=1 Tax=Microvirga sp. ACRRW TaxID=2918205 RepID=UPI001EF6D030|nr:PAS domain-containing protein [Microvirga sp. ACRRW]MCG7392526.1 PAS domain-containing protein [Microvirga sp. ACRRW]